MGEVAPKKMGEISQDNMAATLNMWWFSQTSSEYTKVSLSLRSENAGTRHCFKEIRLENFSSYLATFASVLSILPLP